MDRRPWRDSLPDDSEMKSHNAWIGRRLSVPRERISRTVPQRAAATTRGCRLDAPAEFSTTLSHYDDASTRSVEDASAPNSRQSRRSSILSEQSVDCVQAAIELDDDVWASFEPLSRHDAPCPCLESPNQEMAT